jgi:hypothetical protein
MTASLPFSESFLSVWHLEAYLCWYCLYLPSPNDCLPSFLLIFPLFVWQVEAYLCWYWHDCFPSFLLIFTLCVWQVEALNLLILASKGGVGANLNDTKNCGQLIVDSWESRCNYSGWRDGHGPVAAITRLYRCTRCQTTDTHTITHTHTNTHTQRTV